MDGVCGIWRHSCGALGDGNLPQCSAVERGLGELTAIFWVGKTNKTLIYHINYRFTLNFVYKPFLWLKLGKSSFQVGNVFYHWLVFPHLVLTVCFVWPVWAMNHYSAKAKQRLLWTLYISKEFKCSSGLTLNPRDSPIILNTSVRKQV